MLRKFFANRYGIDQLSILLMIFSIGFIFSKNLFIIGLFIIGYALYRGYSRNFAKRQMELQKYYNFIYKFNMLIRKAFGPIVYKVKTLVNKIKQRKYYKYLKCRYCNKQLRLPKDKGKIKVTCPECKNEFLTKT